MRTIKHGQWVGLSAVHTHRFKFLVVAAVFSLVFAAASVAATTRNKSASRNRSRAEGRQRASDKPTSKVRHAKSAQAVPCHAKGYVDPKIARNYNSAMRDLKRAGIQPRVTSAWRSSAQQAQLHRCSKSRRCLHNNPGLYYALPPGQSLHEAGFAVDISGVASGPRGNKRLTSQGRRIVRAMQKNGFKWRYGLKDPAHFEADPQQHGYRSMQQAIHRNQSMCDAKVAKKSGRHRATVSTGKRTTTTKRVYTQVSTSKSRKHAARA